MTRRETDRTTETAKDTNNVIARIKQNRTDETPAEQLALLKAEITALEGTLEATNMELGEALAAQRAGRSTTRRVRVCNRAGGLLVRPGDLYQHVKELRAMSTTQLWFQQVDPADDDGSKWHAAVTAGESIEGGTLYEACCGFEATHAAVVECDPGVLPIDSDEGICLHCQRALEMERREQDIASGEGMPEPPEENA